MRKRKRKTEQKQKVIKLDEGLAVGDDFTGLDVNKKKVTGKIVAIYPTQYVFTVVASDGEHYMCRL